MKILIVNTRLCIGGIATSLKNLCYALKDYQDIKIDILLLDERMGDDRYIFPQNVNINTIDCRRLSVLTATFDEVRKTKSILWAIYAIGLKIMGKILGKKNVKEYIIKRQPIKTGYDIAISFRNEDYTRETIFGCNEYVLHCTDAPVKIAWIHNDPDRHGITYDVAVNAFKQFNYIVNVSAGCKNRFDEIIPEYVLKSRLVYNTFDYNEIMQKGKLFNPYKNTNKVTLVTVGRVNIEQKRMDRILKICELLYQYKICNYEWHIVGTGKDMLEIKSLAEKNDVYNNIIFEGSQSNPFPYIRYADCLIMTSEYEAFPLTLNEALISGTPIITTNHISAKEIVDNGVTGLIAENSTKGLFDKIKLVMENPSCLVEMKNNIAEKGFDRDLAVNQFLDLINYNI